jgi:hypothetical protein
MLISTFLNSLYEQTLKLGRSRFWLLVLGLIFLVVIFINGIGIVPEEPYQRLSENPFITRTDIHFNNYWQENPLLPVIAFYLGLSSATAFNILCFVILTGAFLLFALLASRRWDSFAALIFSTLLITSPLTTVMLTWLGTPDGLTVALTVPFFFAHSVPLVFILSLLGVTNHPAFMITVIEILVLRWAARDEIKFKHILASAVGLAAGYGLTRWFLAANQIEVVSRTDFMLLKDMGEWLKMNAQNFPMSVSSLFNINWLILPVCLMLFFKRDRVFYLLVLGFLLINYGFTFFTLDTTRVFSLLSWGVLYECIFHSHTLAGTGENEGTEVQKQFLQSLILIGVASFITPRYFSWAGEIHTTPFYQFLRKVFR